MKKENECEIVQDLLLSYIDGLLNDSTKDFVEQHLKSCLSCKEKLETFKDDEKNTKNLEKEINYLKKVKFKSRIKSIIGAIVIILLVFCGYYLNKFFILNNISEKVSKQFETENFYIEKIEKVEDDGVLIMKTWYKDGKYKTTSYIETESDGIIQSFGTQYGVIGQKEKYVFDDTSKKVTKELWPFENSKLSLISFPNPIFLSQQKSYMIFRLGAPFHTKISTDHKEIGRKYYVLDLNGSKLWVDIDTGLPIMSFGYSCSTKYYKDTKIPLTKTESIIQYNYDFGNVKDADVLMPDLSEYELTENSSIIDIVNNSSK